MRAEGQRGSMFHVEHAIIDARAWEASLAAGASAIGLHLGAGDLERLRRHAELVLSDATAGLTAVRAPEQALSVHVLDSLSVAGEVERSSPGPVADLGTGAGYPGIPLAIATGREVVLVESLAKKARFLRSAVAELELGCEVFHGRAEELARSRPAGFAVVVARAVAQLPVLVELAAPLLALSGRLIAMKGSPEVREVERGREVGRLVGLELEHEVPVVVPGLHAARVLVAFRRTGGSSLDLPRRDGMAKKRPLA